MIFYLGTHMPNQTWFDLDVPLFISRVRLTKRQSFPRARKPWALDSAGFTALNKPPHAYTLSVKQYANEVIRFRDEIGMLDWAASMDFMCEPSVLAKTGLTVLEHQRRTIDNFLELRGLIGSLAVPVLQGWLEGEHEAHLAMYDEAGVDLRLEATVGIGSICRRDSDNEISKIVRALTVEGIHCHAFGVRSRALKALRDVLTSADSMAWSYRGRKVQLPGCAGRHKTEANCPRWALMWRQQQFENLNQLTLEAA